MLRGERWRRGIGEGRGISGKWEAMAYRAGGWAVAMRRGGDVRLYLSVLMFVLEIWKRKIKKRRKEEEECDDLMTDELMFL